LKVFVVRHADAGDRERWTRPDNERPLSPKGVRQAAGLVDQLRPYKIKHVATSPYVRCRQTIEPLAAALTLPVEEIDELAEGHSYNQALAVARELGGDAVLCTHGDVTSDLVDALVEGGVVRGDARSPKGSTWVLDVSDGLVTKASFLPAPK
jgi:phosphohistidine phosphatase SixA